MRTTARRLKVLGDHIQKTSATSTGPPYFAVSPRTSLIDEKLRISLHGLEANQMIRLVAKVVENNIKFESHALYRTNPEGNIDLDRDSSLAGTYTGRDPMGLFWSLTPDPEHGDGVRFTKKDVTVPILYRIQAVQESTEGEARVYNSVIAETTVEKIYMKRGVKRIPVKEGRLKGTLFIPEGHGPFPGLIDMFGGLVSLVETRAALLASHGFVTFALAYLYQEGLAQQVFEVELDYIQSATEWLSRQPYVDGNRIGMVGLCYGGNLSLLMAARTPLIKAVVNINGVSIMPDLEAKLHTECPTGNLWPDHSKIYNTKDGIVIHDIFDCVNPTPIPAWQNGAKVLYIVGEDDKQVHPKWHRFCIDSCPPEYKQNLEIHSYPGAGHLIEQPYSPHCRAINVTRRRMATVNFIPENFHDFQMVSGGNQKQHGYAQIDAWKRITEFLHRTLGKCNGNNCDLENG